jgi:hypothetical protein
MILFHYSIGPHGPLRRALGGRIALLALVFIRFPVYNKALEKITNGDSIQNPKTAFEEEDLRLRSAL